MRAALCAMGLIFAWALPGKAQQISAIDHDMRKHHGGEKFLFIEGERLELQRHDGEEFLLWDAQAWYGGDLDKIWLKSEGEFDFQESAVEEAELQALWSRAISPFFDAQFGVRQDFKPSPSRSHIVTGLQGLAPYFFEVDAAFFLSHKGDVTARLEAEYDLLFTQRLILQPRGEMNVAFQDIPELEIGSGLSNFALGLRLRYEVVREFAPYIGIEWHRRLGQTADFARAAGEDAGGLSILAGIRLWY